VLDGRIGDMAKRPLFMISTAGKSADQIKAEARAALAEFLNVQDRNADDDSQVFCNGPLNCGGTPRRQ
jgi:hypothetical protein